MCHQQIRSKGTVEKPFKSKARKATDPRPVHAGVGHELTKGSEQDMAMSPSPPPQNDQDRVSLSGPSSNTLHAPNEKRTRVTARAYPEHGKQLIAATRVYYMKIWTVDPFPDDKLQAKWAVDSWHVASDGEPLPETTMISYVSNVLCAQPRAH